MSDIKCTTLRLNMNNPKHREAWNYLQGMDKGKFKSYSSVIADAVIMYFEKYYKLQDDSYLETREKEDEFVERIISAVEERLKYIEVINTDNGTVQKDTVNELPYGEVEWGFMGL